MPSFFFGAKIVGERGEKGGCGFAEGRKGREKVGKLTGVRATAGDPRRNNQFTDGTAVLGGDWVLGGWQGTLGWARAGSQ